MLQFACAYPWLPEALLSHQFDHLGVLVMPVLLAFELLIVRLTRDLEIMASLADAQSRDLLLLEDLPKGFFGTANP